MPKSKNIVSPVYKIVEEFTVRAGSGDERDDRHITARKKLLRRWIFNIPIYDKKEYIDTTMALYDRIDRNTYQRQLTGKQYTRDRQKYG